GRNQVNRRPLCKIQYRFLRVLSQSLIKSSIACSRSLLSCIMPPEEVNDHISRNQEPNATAKTGQGFAAPIAPIRAKVLIALASTILRTSFIWDLFTE